MSWKQLREFTRTLSFRLNVWHAAFFLASAVLLLLFVQFLLGTAIDAKDQDLLRGRVREYLTIYQSGGVPALRTWATQVNEAREQRLYFVQLTRSDGEVLLRVAPRNWSERDLALIDAHGPLHAREWRRIPRDAEVDLTLATTFLPDGTVLQLGRSSDSRSQLLREFRRAFTVVIPPVILLGFASGALLASRMTRPLRGIVRAASSIIETGKMDVRVPTRPADDELQHLVLLFNRMIESNESLIRALRESLDNVAHDLRTPLARLRATLEHATSSGGDAAAKQHAIADALEETQMVQTIISTLMDVAHAQSGLMTLRVEATALQHLIADVIDLYEHVAQERGVRIVTNFHAEDRVAVDPARMRQVFANLLDNAIKYTPAGGTITITTAQDQQCAQVSFRDTGRGIPAADLPRIWERLFRGDQSRSEHGLGLGLSLVKAIVEAHSGSVTVESTEGEGTEFTVRLPTA
jgi:signal transduction histidine kinase